MMVRALWLVLLVAVGTPVGAQTRYQPRNLFWVHAPDGWSIEERQDHVWWIRGSDEPPGTQCAVELHETMDTLSTPQSALNEIALGAEFYDISRESAARALASPRIDYVAKREIAGVQFIRVQARGSARLDASGPRLPVVIVVMFALTPGQTWRVACGVPQSDLDRMLPQFEQVFSSFSIVDRLAGFNAR